MTIHIEGIEPLLEKLERLDQLKVAINAMKAAALHIKGKINIYPPATEANSPSNPKGRWYERGYGPKWNTLSGVHGRKTSQTLGKKWTIGQADGGLTQIVGNNVTYGPFVQDPEKQAKFHKLHGWKTTAQVAEEEAETVVKFVKDEIDKALE